MNNSTRLAEVAANSYLASNMHAYCQSVSLFPSSLSTSASDNASPNVYKPSTFSSPNSERLPPPQVTWELYNPVPVPLSILISRHGSFPTAWRMVVAEQQACKHILFKRGVIDMAHQVEDALKFKILRHFDVVRNGIDLLPDFPFAPLTEGMNLAVGVAAAVADLVVKAATASFNWALRKAISWEWGVVVSLMIGSLCGLYGVVNFMSVFTLGDEGTIKLRQSAQADNSKTNQARYLAAQPTVLEPEKLVEDNIDAEESILSDRGALSDSGSSSSSRSFNDVPDDEVFGPNQPIALPSEIAERVPEDLSHITIDLDFFDGPTIGSILADWDECVDGEHDVDTADVSSDLSFPIDTVKTVDQQYENIMLEGAVILLYGSDSEASDVQVTDDAVESDEEMYSCSGYEYEMDKNGERRLEALMSDVQLDLAWFVNECDSFVAETGCIRESKSSPAILADRELSDNDPKDKLENDNDRLAVDHSQDSVDELVTLAVSDDLELKICVAVQQPMDFKPEVPVVEICGTSSTNTKTASLLTPAAPTFVPRALQAKDKMSMKPAFQFNPQTAPTFVPRNSSPNPLPSPAPRLHLRSRLFTASLPSSSQAETSSSFVSTSKAPPAFQPRNLPPAFVPSSQLAPLRADHWTDFTLLHVDGSAEKLRMQAPPSFWAPPASPSPLGDAVLEKPKKRRRKRTRRRKNKNKNQAPTDEDGPEALEDGENEDEDEDLEAYYDAEVEVDRPAILA